MTGAGGHITISSVSAAPAPRPSRRNFREPPSLQGETFEAAGLTGERNRRQARSREASAGGTRAAARGPARTERRSAATAFGEGGGGDRDLADDAWVDGGDVSAQQETEKETAREMVKASFRGRGGGRNRRRSILLSLRNLFLTGDVKTSALTLLQQISTLLQQIFSGDSRAEKSVCTLIHTR
jgi:hypothetical protein